MDYEKKYNEAMLRADEAVQKGSLDKNIFDIIFPPEDSEDERIRKELMQFCDDASKSKTRVVSAEKFLEWASWLEKQKEQKPASTEDMPYITDEHFYEREPADSFKYKLAEYMTKNCRKEESPYGYTYHISAESILKMAEEELLKRGVVQKPVELSEDIKRTLDDVSRLLIMLNYKETARNYKQAIEQLISTLPQKKED